MKRIIIWAVAALSFVASAYSLLGVGMVASLSGAPNYSPERARFNASLWGSSTIVFFSIGVICLIFLWRIHRKTAH